MSPYLLLKVIHVLSAMLFFGTGLGSAWYKLRADRSGQLETIAWAQREIVRADWIFTVPSAVVLPVSGLAMAWVAGMPLSTPWLLLGLIGYAIAGLCWLPAAFLQIRMRRMVDEALREGTALPPAFHRANRTWMLLGLPSFAAAMGSIWVMVMKSGW